MLGEFVMIDDRNSCRVSQRLAGWSRRYVALLDLTNLHSLWCGACGSRAAAFSLRLNAFNGFSALLTFAPSPTSRNTE